MEVLGDTFVPPGLDTTWFATRTCPTCTDGPLVTVKTVHEPHRLCPSCGACWRIEHGRLRLVDPVTCRGCATRSKAACLDRLQRTFPRYNAGTATDIAGS